MALEQSDLLTVGGVVAILVGMVVFNAYAARRPRPAAQEEAPATGSLLCKFVTHEGSVVGETVAIEGERAILKQAGVFKAVPTAGLQPEGAELVLRGPIDWPAAEREGTAWYDAHRGEGSEEVAGVLTRSQDVRAPALDAFLQRAADSEE